MLEGLFYGVSPHWINQLLPLIFSPIQAQGGWGLYIKIEISVKFSSSHVHTFLMFCYRDKYCWWRGRFPAPLQTFCMTYGQVICDASWRAEIAVNDTWASPAPFTYQSLAPNAHHRLTPVFLCLSFPFLHAEDTSTPPAQQVAAGDTRALLN